jgi:hypothetical protein
MGVPLFKIFPPFSAIAVKCYGLAGVGRNMAAIDIVLSINR